MKVGDRVIVSGKYYHNAKGVITHSLEGCGSSYNFKVKMDGRRHAMFFRTNELRLESENNNFIVGDRVKVVKPTHSRYALVGVVREIIVPDSVMVEFDEVKGSYYLLPKKELVLAKPKTQNIGLMAIL